MDKRYVVQDKANDGYGNFDLDEAKAHAKRLAETHFPFHVRDLITGEIVFGPYYGWDGSDPGDKG